MKRTFVVALHVGYWLAYLALLGLVFTLWGLQSDRSAGLVSLVRSPIGVLAVVPGALAFYLGYFVLFPAFLAPRRFAALGAGMVAAIGSAAVVGMLTVYLLFGGEQPVFGAVSEMIGLAVLIGLVALAHLVIALITRGFVDWYGAVSAKEDLLRKNHEVELALVRSRLDPHFLFNTLNNIDVLIEKDPPRASRYLNELSELMRFVLYGSRRDLIPLAEELRFIEKYVGLERIRVAQVGFVTHEVDGDPGPILVAPMSFIPFIENAFKHSSGHREAGTISSRFRIESGRVRFECSNRYGAVPAAKTADGGLGNELIRRRLALLYPGRHTLEVIDRDHVYSVHLSLDVADSLHHR